MQTLRKFFGEMHQARYSEPSWYQTSKNSTISRASYLRNGSSCSDQAQSSLRWLDPKLKSWQQIHERPWAGTTNLSHFQILKLQKLSSVQSLSRVRLFVTPWTEAHQASLSITNSQSLPKLMSIELVMPSNHLILCRPLLLLPSIFPGIRVFFPMSQLFAWGGQSTGVSASASVHPMNTQDWSPLEWTGLISLQSKGLSRVFSNTTVQKHQFFGAQLSL